MVCTPDESWCVYCVCLICYSAISCKISQFTGLWNWRDDKGGHGLRCENQTHIKIFRRGQAFWRVTIRLEYMVSLRMFWVEYIKGMFCLGTASAWLPILCHFVTSIYCLKYYVSWNLEVQDFKKHPVESHEIKWQSDKCHRSLQAYYLQTECLTNLWHLDDFFLPWDTPILPRAWWDDATGGRYDSPPACWRTASWWWKVYPPCSL